MVKAKTKGFFTKGRMIVLTILLILLVYVLIGLDQRLIVRNYQVDVPGADISCRLVLVTDLHDCVYGENQQELLDAIAAQQPDAVLLGGDIFDDKDRNPNTVAFLQGIAGKYPCYYVAGNHEHAVSKENYVVMIALLNEMNIRVLHWEKEALNIDGTTLWLCGADSPSAHSVRKLKAMHPGDENFTILLSHKPELIERYAQGGYDLVLAGHAHGGQWRLPGLVNGLFAPDQGFFPQYAGGLYTQGKTTMIVSRGLARESTPLPRFYNRPELVVVDLQ